MGGVDVVKLVKAAAALLFLSTTPTTVAFSAVRTTPTKQQQQQHYSRLLETKTAAARTSSSSSLSAASTGRSNSNSSNGDGNPPPFSNYYAPTSSSVDATSAPTNSPPVVVPHQPPPPSDAQPMAAIASSPTSLAAIMKQFQTSQDSVIARLQHSIPDLTTKTANPTNSDSPLAGHSHSNKVQAWDAPGGKANVAYMSSLCVCNDDTATDAATAGVGLCSLSIFNGPLSFLPHLTSRVVVAVAEGTASGGNRNVLEIALDLHPRSYGAYELQDDQGNYPGPEQLGRKAFEYAANRNEFFTNFGSSEQVQALLVQSKTVSFPDGPVIPVVDSDDEAQRVSTTRGPLALHVQVPCTQSNIQAVNELRTNLTLLWISWQQQQQTMFQHRPGAPVNTQYVYDTKFRQNAYLSLLKYYQQKFGTTLGKELAVMESGPLDEAYVGGAS